MTSWIDMHGIGNVFGGKRLWVGMPCLRRRGDFAAGAYLIGRVLGILCEEIGSAVPAKNLV